MWGTVSLDGRGVGRPGGCRSGALGRWDPNGTCPCREGASDAPRRHLSWPEKPLPSRPACCPTFTGLPRCGCRRCRQGPCFGVLGYSELFSLPPPAWHGLPEEFTASVAELPRSPGSRLCFAENVLFVVLQCAGNKLLALFRRQQLGQPPGRQPVCSGNVFSRDDVTSPLWASSLLGP